MADKVHYHTDRYKRRPRVEQSDLPSDGKDDYFEYVSLLYYLVVVIGFAILEVKWTLHNLPTILFKAKL